MLPSATSPSRIWKAVELHVMAARRGLSIVWEKLWFLAPETERGSSSSLGSRTQKTWTTRFLFGGYPGHHCAGMQWEGSAW